MWQPTLGGTVTECQFVGKMQQEDCLTNEFDATRLENIGRVY